MNNLLKKAFDSNKETLTEPIDLKINLTKGIGQPMEIQLFEIVREPNKDYPHSRPIVALNYRVIQGETTKQFSIKPYTLTDKLRAWFIRLRPMKVVLSHDGFETEYSYETLADSYKIEDDKEQEIIEMDEDACPSYDYNVVMGYRLAESIQKLFHAIYLGA